MTIQVEILQFLHYNPSSSRVEIAAGLTEAPNERTLKRIIAGCVRSGDIVMRLARENTSIQTGDESARIRFHNSMVFSIFVPC